MAGHHVLPAGDGRAKGWASQTIRLRSPIVGGARRFGGRPGSPLVHPWTGKLGPLGVAGGRMPGIPKRGLGRVERASAPPLATAGESRGGIRLLWALCRRCRHLLSIRGASNVMAARARCDSALVETGNLSIPPQAEICQSDHPFVPRLFPWARHAMYLIDVDRGPCSPPPGSSSPTDGQLHVLLQSTDPSGRENDGILVLGWQSSTVQNLGTDGRTTHCLRAPCLPAMF